VYITPLGGHLEAYGGPLTVRYNMSKGIFRFGNETGVGSEHRIDGRAYDAELQLLLSSDKPTSSDCFIAGYGVAMIVVLFQKRAFGNPYLESFVKSTALLWHKGNSTTLQIPLSFFLPNSTTKYYLYLGSLTFPPCTGGITVIVFSQPVDIGEDQLKSLRNNLYTYEGSCRHPMAGNLRPVKKLETQVYRSFKFTGVASASRRPAPTTTAWTAVLTLTLCGFMLTI
ncbi:unnamed protein product, partial [Ixodes hexagonus]